MRTSPIRLDEDVRRVLRRDRWSIVVVGVITGFATTVRFGARSDLPAHLVFVLIASVLVVCDVRLMRLPDAFTLPGYPLLAVLLAIPLDAGAYPRALLAMITTSACHLLLALPRGGMGMGDVKVAGLVGLILGWSSWVALARALVPAYLCAALYLFGRRAVARAASGTAIAFEPFLL
ncbi:prepilin peptidase, partial [Embleya sp. NPDC001921]